MYSVNQHWDPLKVCAVGKSYPPEFYSFITNTKARTVMETIAQETEEDYQKLITLLESFNVEVVRPTISDDFSEYYYNGRYMIPPMCPRDSTIMVGNKFYFGGITIPKLSWDLLYSMPRKDILRMRMPDVPDSDFLDTPVPLPYDSLLKELAVVFGASPNLSCWGDMLTKVQSQGNEIVMNAGVNAAMLTRIGKDLYHGLWYYEEPEVT